MFPIRKQYFNPGGSHLYKINIIYVFDFPYYAGLPKKISNTLSSEAVDAMQEILQNRYSRKYLFAKAYKETLRGLGERGYY